MPPPPDTRLHKPSGAEDVCVKAACGRTMGEMGSPPQAVFTRGKCGAGLPKSAAVPQL